MVVYTDCGSGGPFFMIEGPPGAFAEAEKIASLICADCHGEW